MNISNTVVNNMDIIERLGQMNAKYVVGNHDIDLIGFVGKKVLVPKLFDNLCPELTQTIEGKTFKFVHGHELDPYNTGDDPGKGRVLTILAGMAKSAVGAPVLFGKYSVEVFLEGGGRLAVLFEGAVNHHGGETERNSLLAGLEAVAVVEVHRDRNVRIFLDRRKHEMLEVREIRVLQRTT